jgi:hypothetical protein
MNLVYVITPIVLLIVICVAFYIYHTKTISQKERFYVNDVYDLDSYVKNNNLANLVYKDGGTTPSNNNISFKVSGVITNDSALYNYLATKTVALAESVTPLDRYFVLREIPTPDTKLLEINNGQWSLRVREICYNTVEKTVIIMVTDKKKNTTTPDSIILASVTGTFPVSLKGKSYGKITDNTIFNNKKYIVIGLATGNLNIYSLFNRPQTINAEAEQQVMLIKDNNNNMILQNTLGKNFSYKINNKGTELKLVVDSVSEYISSDNIITLLLGIKTADNNISILVCRPI